jgi:hypothetical protein
VAADAAQPGLVVEPVDLAQAWADAAAIFEQRERALCAFAELAGGVEREVGRMVIAHVRSLARRRPEVTRVVR